MNNKNIFKIIIGLIVLVKPLLNFMLLAIILGVIGYLCAIFIPITGTSALLTVVGFELGRSLNSLFICLVMFGIFRGIFRYGEQTCNHYIAFKLLAVIRDKVFGVLRKLCPAKLECKDKGNLISLITNDVELLEVFYAHTISPIVIAAIVSIIMIFYISSLSITAGIIATIAYITVGIIIPVINTNRVSNDGKSYRNETGSLNTLFLDSLRGLFELIQFGKTCAKKTEVEFYTDKLGSIHKNLKAKEITSRNITDYCIYFFNVFMIVFQSLLYANGKIEFSNALLSIVSLISSYGPVLALSSLSNTLAQTLASGERVLSLLEEKPETPEITNGEQCEISDIKCTDLTFSYDKELILNKINITAKQSKITGIYGKSGCGKSTLLKLIMRFWDCDSGEIKLSGKNIETINTQLLRKNESYCTQETYLFHDTIFNNIKIGKINASNEEVVAAAKAASIHDFITTLPKGYDTQIGELGDRLSGGEKQRIGIARAFLSGANIMLLDEPTSNLDSLNEAIILNSIKNVSNKTVVLISHRKSTLGIADTVYSLESIRRS